MKRQLLTLALAIVSACAMAQAPAFPGAEGHGRYTTGGRGGQVIHVTNLNDSGAGSFRNAVNGNSKKIIVFDVAGVIALKSNLTIGSNTTILGQTAPAPGITLRYYTINTEERNNIIVRFMRFRRGQEKDVNDGADAATGRHSTGIIFDHCSFSWSIDEVASFYDNNNFTMQWCTIGESLNNAGHGKGAHGYGGIWGGKLASLHHNLICHVNNRSPRFNGARYEWKGYTKNQLYSQYNWANEVQAEIVDFRNCVIYNCGNGCYGGPGGGYVNMINNYYKTGPAATTNRVTTVSIANSTSSSDNKKYWDMTSRYFIKGNQMNNTANYDWQNVSYDNGVQTINGERYTLDSLHCYGDTVTYVKNDKGVDCVKIKLDGPSPAGEITTHSAANAFDKVLTYSGASLIQDDVDKRYFSEARNGTATYSGSVTKKKGRIDLVSDVNGYTEENFGTGSREEGFDTDKDGIPDAWETANGLNPNDATDAITYTLDPAKYYTNIEVYANSLVQDIMLAGNSDAEDSAKEYYPAYKTIEGASIEAINTLGIDLSGDTGGETTEEVSYTVSFNQEETQSTDGYFTFGDSSNKHNLNSKFTGKYKGIEYTQGLKMEGSTLIQFTSKGTATVIIAQSDWESADKPHGTPKSLKFDGTELDASTAAKPNDSEGVLVYTITGVAPGVHKITRGSGESGVFHVEVKEAGTTAISTPLRTSAITTTEYYTLDGRRLQEPQRGINIRVERLANGQSITTKVIK